MSTGAEPSESIGLDPAEDEAAGGPARIAVPAPPVSDGEALVGRLSMLLVVLLGALTFRVVVVAVAGIIGWEHAGGLTQGQRFGESLVMLGGFGDGQGLGMLLAALGLLVFISWQASPTASSRNIQWRWLQVLFIASAAGSAAIIVGNSYVYVNLLGTRFEWSHLLSTGGFAAAYLVVELGGAAVCHLQMRPQVRPEPDPGESVNPYLDAAT